MKWSKVSSLLSADTPTIMTVLVTVLVNALGRLVDDPGFKTFKELDLAHGLPKGSAFRAFKCLADSLVEGRDFYCCDVRLEGDAYDQLSASGRVYAGTVNGVLLAPAAQAAIALRLKP